MSENNRKTAVKGATPVKKPEGYARITPEEARRIAARKAQERAKTLESTNTVRKGTAAKAGQSAEKRTASASKKKAKKKRSVFPIVLAMLLICALAVGGFLVLGGGNDDGAKKNPDQNVNTPSVVSDPGNDENSGNEFAFAKIANDDNTLPSAGGYSVKVSDLSVTKGLDENWMNILLLGTDARTLSEPARTDTMIICSIHQKTGEVKLASIMRDTNVFFEGAPANGTRINNAFFYGGPQLAMKVVNECFGMNIEKYVCVNFDGFAVIAEMIGGVDMMITENEMKHINKNVMDQYHIMIDQGKIDYDVAEKEYFDTLLTKYTTNNDKIHLNGMQALGYARIRKLDSDYARTDRQRKVLNALMEEMKGKDIVSLTMLGAKCLGYFNTNLSLQGEILKIAELVLNRADFQDAKTMHLPVQGTYVEERRNDDARLYDMDTAANTRALNDFIYK